MSLSEVSYSFKQLSTSSCKKSKNIITDSFKYHPKRGDREKEIIAQTFIDASLNNTKITILSDKSRIIKDRLGLIALSNGSLPLEDKVLPAVIIDFIFVDNRYRGDKNKDITTKVSKILLTYAIQTSLKISELSGVRYLVLRPDGGKENKKLVSFYESMDFRYMTDKHEWMYLKLT